MLRIALTLCFALAVPAIARADMLPLAAGSPFHHAIEIESDDTAHVFVLFPVDGPGGRPGRNRGVAAAGQQIDLGREWTSPCVWALRPEELAALPEWDGEELDAWMAAFTGPRSDELEIGDARDLHVASVVDVYSARVEGERVVLRLVRSEYEHHTGTREVVDALPDGSRGMPGFSPIDDARVAFGVVPFCCYPLPCCGLFLITPLVLRVWRRRRERAAAARDAVP